MGRKPISDERKYNTLRIMLTESERTELEAAAALAGEKVSTWARTLLLATARSPQKPKKKT